MFVLILKAKEYLFYIILEAKPQALISLHGSGRCMSDSGFPIKPSSSPEEKIELILATQNPIPPASEQIGDQEASRNPARFCAVLGKDTAD